MTTLIGIKAEKGREGVILASDLSRTTTTWNPQGDVAYREQTKSEGQKIYVDSKREVALCMSGIFDDHYMRFLSKIINGEIDVRKVVEKGFFEELASLNNLRWNAQVPDTNRINGLLLATRFGSPKLYNCWPLGRVEERSWTSTGSGSQYALTHINKQGKLIPYQLSICEGIDLAVSGLDEASQDIYTGGLDLVVLTSEGIDEWGADIKKRMKNAKLRTISSLRKVYSK